MIANLECNTYFLDTATVTVAVESKNYKACVSQLCVHISGPSIAQLKMQMSRVSAIQNLACQPWTLCIGDPVYLELQIRPVHIPLSAYSHSIGIAWPTQILAEVEFELRRGLDAVGKVHPQEAAL